MNKTVSIILTLGVLIFLGIIFGGSAKQDGAISEGQNVKIKDGIQYITISAKGGYSPQKTVAEAGIPTKLIVKTEGTFDCSASLVVRSAGFQEILPQTGEVEIDLGIPVAGEPVQGLCSMGMYNFEINFN